MAMIQDEITPMGPKQNGAKQAKGSARLQSQENTNPQDILSDADGENRESMAFKEVQKNMIQKDNKKRFEVYEPMMQGAMLKMNHPAFPQSKDKQYAVLVQNPMYQSQYRQQIALNKAHDQIYSGDFQANKQIMDLSD